MSGLHYYYFEYILEATDDHILLIQEHWRLPDELGTWKSIAFRRGWHGIWHAANSTQNTEESNPGKSG
eukprot:16171533-Heterocapsa_arctica.AAC.1